MHSMDEARATCDRHLPGFYQALTELPLTELEVAGSPGLDLFRKHGGPGLLIPQTYSGLGVSPREALQINRVIGSCAPSLAVASTMHHFSVATIFTLAESLQSSGLEWALLEGIATSNMLVGSGFAEGNPGQGVLAPTLRGAPREGGILVNGSKKPCSMARSMDLLSASVSVSKPEGDETVVVLIPADTQGISVHPFWVGPILAGAESDEVRLTDVFVDDRLIVPAGFGPEGELDDLQTVGFIWFEMLITACYLGMASGLVERVFAANRTSAADRAELGIRLESAAMLLERIAGMLADGRTGNRDLTEALTARYAAADAIANVAVQALAALGGIAFITEPDIGYLATACQCVRFHPPGRRAMEAAMVAGLSGETLLVE
ncbi:acyl-CoA/acyl-ACP dehydrogenase [Nocardia cyriacigeorgica]|uniref:Acyl-CoA/acyl-ACP dehydrogenase n=1 Tax=Nocardia cyriacigeorgica TaxID=135487 RepID=A0A6P1CIC3_9NOCA|nr:acyl-CoA/acyl-ACP dehydrogenase [Nocardia cyriacigeorgica]MBF6285057.1 acyl-CoA/acyl-ACP dehydrogenase [Nocardia cyriacigeorgica]NEW32148.1 acyl-CoA/acyl-ACP dehydrogenase [Nocardia cyriacigeorgica]